MEQVKWSLKNIQTGDILNISKSVFKIGRHADADLTSLTSSLSRNHATLSILIDGCLYVQDNKSCNGTFLNKQKIPAMEMKLLKHGDIVGFGYCQKICADQTFDTTLLVFEVLKSDGNIEIKDASSDKLEVNERNTTKCKSEKQDEKVETHLNVAGYSIGSNECIVISDGEDDEDLFSSSQIFKLSEKIKIEQTSLNESVDPYLHIKQELEDLDSCDNIQNVDLTSDQEGFDSTSDLINILESPDNIIEHKILGECSSGVSPKPRFTKPPIIEPHFCTKVGRDLNINRPKRKNKLVVKTDADNKNLISKRKNTDTNPESNKKIKTGSNFVESGCDKKSIAEEFKKRNKAKNGALHKTDIDKESKKNILIERKKKLKEISEKDNSKSCHEPITKANVSTSKIKCSNGRGGFLLENSLTSTTTKNIKDVPSTSKCVYQVDIKTNQSSVSKDKKGYEKYSNLNKNFEENHIQDTTISSNFSPKSDSNVLQLPITTTVLSNKTVYSSQRPDSTSNEDRSGFIWKTASSLARPTINNINRNITNIDDEICKIVHWSVKWLMEQNNCDMSPPVNGDREPVKMPLSINSFSDYYNIVVPLIMLELWQYVYQTLYNKDEERTPIRVFLNHKRIVGRLTYLDCECYISEEDMKTNNIFRTDDFALIELKLKDAANGYIYTGFGYVKFCKRINLKDDMIINNNIARLCPGIPHANLKFTLVTRNLSDKEIMGTQIIVKVIANIASSLRLFKTVKFLEISPLLKQVLSPNIEDYKLSTESKNLIVEVNLNNQQKKIVLEACDLCLRNKPGIYLIKGPPGTGKSTVIINTVLQIIFSSANNQKKPLILLTAPSNAAVDGLILKLAETRVKLPESQRKFLKLVRIGPDSSISKSVDKFKLSSLARNHILKDKGLFTLEKFKDALEKGNLEQFLRDVLGYNYFYEMKCAEDILLFGSNVICTTLNSCVGSRIMESVRREQLKFTCCIIDEATQCCEAELLLPIQLGVDKFVLVGDPQQLPAVVCNKDAQKLGYGKSLFARIDDSFKEHKVNPIKMLYEQYRMKPEICEYPNKTFYGGKLKSFPIHTNKIVPELKPYLLFNLLNTENEDISAYRNSEEVQLIYNLLDTLSKHIQSKCTYSIGIITPYRAQKELLTRHISNIRFNPNVSITVNTVDSFQGMENDVIIISCVRYTTNYFLQNSQRLNVALTRARQALYVIGNYALFKHCSPLYDLREDAKKRRLCIDLNLNQVNTTNLYGYIIQR